MVKKQSLIQTADDGMLNEMCNGDFWITSHELGWFPSNSDNVTQHTRHKHRLYNYDFNIVQPHNSPHAREKLY